MDFASGDSGASDRGNTPSWFENAVLAGGFDKNGEPLPEISSSSEAAEDKAKEKRENKIMPKLEFEI